MQHLKRGINKFNKIIKDIDNFIYEIGEKIF